MLLFPKGGFVPEPGAFNPPSIITDSNGNFNDNLDIDPSVSAGQYEVRADFNGTWILYGFQYNVPIINDSSTRIELNLTTILRTRFYIDGIPKFN
ncbi:MAG: hypothetical protein ACW972_10210, partial [Promethearchaeota archaeon]